MNNTEEGIFRKCAVFDTHVATYYLDDNKKIVGIESEEIKNKMNLFGKKTNHIIGGFLGNCVLFAVNNTKEEILELLKDINIVYGKRIDRWKK